MSFERVNLFGIFSDGEAVQPSLFDSVRYKRLGLEKIIDHLREKFGKDAVVPASLIRLEKVK